jgi:hypothetical protein
VAGPGVDLVQLVIDRQAISVNEDVAVITMHCRGVQAALPDDLFPLDDAGRDDFNAKITAWWGLIQPMLPTGYKLTVAKFYPLPAAAGEPMGPPHKTYTHNASGVSGAPLLPTQVAMSVTFITDQRKTWGRFYIPGTNPNALTGGRWSHSDMQAVADATHHLTDRSGNGGCLTVWSRKEWTHHDPQTIQVDDIPDVIRSRRLKSTLFRATHVAG